jgi:hypothetical protein
VSEARCAIELWRRDDVQVAFQGVGYHALVSYWYGVVRLVVPSFGLPWNDVTTTARRVRHSDVGAELEHALWAL